MLRSRTDVVSDFEVRPQPIRRALYAVPDPGDGIGCLTRREREVLALIAAGCSNEGICDALVVSPKTVESHVHSIFLKLALPRDATVHPRVLATRAWLQANPVARAA
jgi:DNA-binding NarL/FixJ family response regulator